MSSDEVKELKGYKADPIVILAGLVLAGVFFWTYTFAGKESSSSLSYLWYQWFTPDYQHGFFVLPFCLFLLWHRREMMTEIPAQGSWWGLAFFAFWAGVRLCGAFYNYPWLQLASIIPGVAAIVLFVGGWRAILWAWPAIVFMAFMIPLPGSVTDFLSQPLQKIGSICSVFVIQTLGIPSLRQDIVIVLRDTKLNVEEACSGIKMLMLFFALCMGTAFILNKKQLWERLLIVASAIPIAVLANIFRLTMTAILIEFALKWPNLLTAEHAQKWMHDFAGLMMMPFALIVVWIEWTLLSKLFIEEPADRAVAIRGTTRGLLTMAAAPRQSNRP